MRAFMILGPCNLRKTSFKVVLAWYMEWMVLSGVTIAIILITLFKIFVKYVNIRLIFTCRRFRKGGNSI